jgi:Transglutaminase-like superfamily
MGVDFIVGVDFGGQRFDDEKRSCIVVYCRILFASSILLLGVSALNADDARGIRLGQETTSQWRFGVVVKAPGGPVSGITATLPVPMDWPEQTVKKVGEDKTANVRAVTYQTLDGGVRQMIVKIPRLNTGGEASTVVTFEVSKRRIEPPTDTSIYQVPAKPGPELRKFLAPSPYIESKDPKIQALAAELTADKERAWDKAATIFDWVRDNIKYEFADDIRPANVALDDGKGDCEELSSLVVAMCRASKIPARAVWVPRHTYPEFYLIDDQGKGHWFPCQAAGAERQFGGMIEDRPILQKGDNFTVPGERTPQRYVKQSLTATDAAAPPEVKFIMEPVKSQ